MSISAVSGHAATAPAATPSAAASATPPIAKKVPWKTTRFGSEVQDDYRWLQEKQKPEVIDYLKAENAYTDAMTAHIAPLKDKLYQEMKGRIKETDLSVSVRRGPFYYYSRVQAGKQYPILCRRKAKADLSDDPKAREEILIDENNLAKGKKFFAIGDFAISPDHQWLAYTVDETGFRQYQLQVKNLKTGQLLKDTLPRITSLEWAGDNQTLFLVQEDANTKRSDRLLRLVLGKPANQVYHEADVEFSLHVSKTHDQKFIELMADSTNTSEIKWLGTDQPYGVFRPMLGRIPNHRYALEHRAGQVYILTNLDAKNFRLVRTTRDTLDPSNWETVVAHDPKVLLEHMTIFKDFMVLTEKTMAQQRQRIFDFTKQDWKTVTFDEPVYLSSVGENPEFDSKQLRMQYQSPVTPRTVLEVNMADGSRRTLKQQEVLGGYDPARYETRRLWATARDGVQVPLWAVYKKGVLLDGSAPLLLYGYGSYGYPTEPNFSAQRLSLLDRGVIYVDAQIRGGNEMGEAWHDDGMLMKKKNTFFDFIDSAQFLIDQKWTRPDRLIIEGGSAGGLLMGAVVNFRPDLFHAVHAAVPFVDVMNSMLNPDLPGTTPEYPEWGNPNQKEAYDYMLSYSPYDNIERKAYPAMLVTTGLNDSQVMYWEPAKYVAKLRTHKTDDKPLLLKTNMGAGHGGASGRYDALGEKAFESAWMLDQWGIKE
jgi:oligopeptidase B